MQKELVEATGIKLKEGEPRQKMLRRLVAAAQALEESDWDALSTPVQNWVNAGQKVINDGDADDEIKDFKDYTPPAEEAEDEEEKAPVKKKKKPADDEEEETVEEEAADEPEEDEEPAPKKKKKPADDEDEDEPPKKKSAKKKAEPDDDEEEEVKKPVKKTAAKVAAKKIAEKPAKATKKAAKKERDLTVSGTKFDITKAVIKNPKLTAAEIFEKLGGKKAGISEITVAAVRANVRHTLQSLIQLELLDIEL